MSIDEVKIVEAARLAHEVNRAYCQSIGDNSILSWDDSPMCQKESLIEGVKGVILKPTRTPEESHQGWLDFKTDEGWTYGEEKDPAKKTHPCMVPYADLPESQKVKDTIFLSVVRGFLGL